MALPTLQELLEAGAHFGHDPSRWNPKMASYIFGVRNGVHVIDLEKTRAGLERAVDFVRELTAKGGVVLFVGTKRQARSIIKTEAERCGMPYVTARWLGGTFTNFPTILKSIEKRSSLAERLASPDAALLTKKDRQKMAKEIERLDTVLEGLRSTRKVPEAVFLIGAHDEKLAVKEAKRMRIPVVAIVDTNADPTDITYVVPANDDAVRSITMLARAISDAILEGRQAHAAQAPPAATPAAPETPPPAPVTAVPAGEPGVTGPSAAV